MELLIFDELMSGFDLEGVYLVKEVIWEVKVEGRIVFFLSYIFSEVEELSDCVGIIVCGRLKVVGFIWEIKC